MKKVIFAIIAVATLSIASCKKEETVQPVSIKGKAIADTKESGAGWD